MFAAFVTLVMAAHPAVGTWEGPLKVGPIELRLVVKVRADGDALKATLDSPDQGAKDIPFTRATFADGKLALDLVNGAKFAGTVGGDVLAGEWKQSGQTFPLELKRVLKATEDKRPQTPKPPLPYAAEDVKFPSAEPGVTLAGTLTLPQGAGPFPAAVLVSGSGPQDRDESLFGHKPFAVLADHLTRRGVAVLRYDDRGVGGSTGQFANSTSADFARDARGAVDFLRGRQGIDAKRVGVIGHSEGGVIAPLVAAEVPDLGFAVLLAGPGVPGRQIMLTQTGAFARSMGTPEAEVKALRGVLEALAEVVAGPLEGDAFRNRLGEVAAEEEAKLSQADRKEFREKVRAALVAKLSDPWQRWFLKHDPRPTLAKVRCPVLALTGEKDIQVDPKENLPEIEKAVRSGGNGRVSVRELPGLNHLFQTCKTGALSEYAKIEETFAPAALEAVSAWVLGLK